MRRTSFAVLLAALAASTASTAAAQAARAPTVRSFSYFGADDPDRAMLGVTTSPGGRRDTLGLLVESVTSGSPADKAGIEEGNRLQSINGVNLKLARDDADDPEMYGVSQNRLIREMRKVKAGDEVTIEVWGGSRARTVRVKTVAARDLTEQGRTMAAMARRDDQRPAIGVMLSSTGSKRDTIGVFVEQVVVGGPAEKAGVIEGDRIASVNGVDVRVAREDAGDAAASSARLDRLTREVQKLKPGETADLVVVAGGRSRNVKVTVGRASEVNAGGFGGDATMHLFGAPGARSVIIGPEVRAEVQSNLDRELPRLLEQLRQMPRKRIITSGDQSLRKRTIISM